MGYNFEEVEYFGRNAASDNIPTGNVLSGTGKSEELIKELVPLGRTLLVETLNASDKLTPTSNIILVKNTTHYIVNGYTIDTNRATILCKIHKVGPKVKEDLKAGDIGLFEIKGVMLNIIESNDTDISIVHEIFCIGLLSD